MKNKVLKLKKSLIQKIIGLFSLTALVFVFEACYGTPQDFGEDVEISGMVKSAKTGEAVQGIKVELKNQDYFLVTGQDGSFSFFTSPGQDYYLSFTDDDQNSSGSYTGKDTIVKNKDGDLLNLEILLNESE